MGIPEERIVQTLDEIYEAFNKGNFDAAIDHAHPEIVLARAGDQSDIVGKDAVRAWMEPDAFEFQRFTTQSIEVSGNRALVELRTDAQGAGSGIEIGLDALIVWTFDDDGRITQLETFFTHQEDEARRALSAP